MTPLVKSILTQIEKSESVFHNRYQNMETFGPAIGTIAVTRNEYRVNDRLTLVQSGRSKTFDVFLDNEKVEWIHRDDAYQQIDQAIQRKLEQQKKKKINELIELGN
jgi:hypothetical protein